ncbi:MAG: orotate phosphoribosyltransferase [Chitinophagaceae bacterium]
MSEALSSKFTPSKKIAKYLLDIKAVKFNVEQPFTWASGIVSPIYCDNRIINSKVEVRNAVVNEFSNIIARYYLPETQIIVGVATGGIPYGVLAADRLSLPFIYVREKRKEHGLKKMVEGYFEQGNRVVLIEDLISTGMSSRRAIDSLRSEGLHLISLISIMTYGFKEADEEFKKEHVEHVSICDLDTILEVAQEEGILHSKDLQTILQFKESPKTWGQ